MLFLIIISHIGKLEKKQCFFYFEIVFRNAKGHVQPFVLVQPNKLPSNRLVSITCRALAPGIEHSTRGMRGMVSFQLYRQQNNG